MIKHEDFPVAFAVALPEDDPKMDPGWRLLLYREPYELLWLSEERVLPEKAADPLAYRIVEKGERLMLKRRQVAWLIEQLTAALAQWNSEGE